MFIVDAHLDLSMNALDWNRDLTKSVQKIRERELGKTDKPDRGRNTVSFPELRKGNIGLVVGTMIARYVDEKNSLPGWHSPEQAWAQTQGQLAWYHAMENAGEIKIISSKKQLANHLDNWNKIKTDKKAIGLILSLEGADSIVDLKYLELAYTNGLRALGPAHYGPGRYANGTDSSGHLNDAGKLLLKSMNSLNMILDVTHLCDDAFWDAMDLYSGPLWASHNNCRSIVNHNRQFDDNQLKTIIQRNGVIGAALDAWMIVPDWKRGISNPKEMNCDLNKVIDHMIHICNLAGNSHHMAIGSDLDGAFGTEQSPYDIDTIADLQAFPNLLSSRGFSDDDIKKIMHQNWIDFLQKNLPE